MTDPTNAGDPARPLPPPPGASTPTPPAPPTAEQAAVPAPPPPPGATPPPPPGAEEVGEPAPKKGRRWVLPTVVGVVALLVGIVIGAASSQASLSEKDDELAAVRSERDDYRSQVEDREAQQAADEAEAQRIQAEKEEADRKAAEDQAAAEKAAADQAAADQAAAEQAAQEQAAAAAAAEAVKNTIPGSGIFEIGGDKSPGTYRTPGPNGDNLVGCYYAVLSAPNGFDNIIDNNIIQGPGIVTLQAGQYFETNGCQDWTRS